MRPTPILVTTIALALSAWTLCAQENQPPRPPSDTPREGGPRPGNPGGEGQRAMPGLFAALDANHDGAIDREELKHAAEVIGKMDRNGDGKITPDEMRPPGDGQRPQGGEARKPQGDGARAEGQRRDGDRPQTPGGEARRDGDRPKGPAGEARRDGDRPKTPAGEARRDGDRPRNPVGDGQRPRGEGDRDRAPQGDAPRKDAPQPARPEGEPRRGDNPPQAHRGGQEHKAGVAQQPAMQRGPQNFHPPMGGPGMQRPPWMAWNQGGQRGQNFATGPRMEEMQKHFHEMQQRFQSMQQRRSFGPQAQPPQPQGPPPWVQ